MRRLHPVLGLLLIVPLSVTHVPMMQAPSDAPATPTVAPSSRQRVRLRTAYTAFLRTAPDWDHDRDRVVLPQGTAVAVHGVVPDGSERLGGYWYQVEAFPAGRAPATGWLHATVVYLTPAQLATLDTNAPPAPTANESLTQSSAPLPAAGAGHVPTAGPTIVVPLALRVCYDLHTNKTCDVDEGIGGVPVYGTDSTTGHLHVTAVTDASGIVQFRWPVPIDDAHARLTVTVPYFGAVRTVTPTQATLDPVLVTALAPIPAWLP